MHGVVKLFSLFVALSTAPVLFAQTTAPTHVSVAIKGLKMDTAYLGYHYGGQFHTIDSTRVDTTNGHFSFSRAGLQAGLFYVAAPNGRFFDFVIDQPGTSYRFEGSVEHPDSLRALNSAENEAFFAYQRKRRAALDAIRAQEEMFNLLRQATKDTRVLKEAEFKNTALYRSLDSLAEQQISLHPDHLYPKMLAGARLPKPPKKMHAVVQGRLAPEYVSWVRLHYWDNTRFADTFLLRSDVWPQYFNDFFARWVHPMPDSAAADIDRMLARMPKNKSFYQYVVVELTKAYESSQRPGADRLFVHLVDRYQKIKETPWLDEPTLLRLAAKANFHRPNLTGNPAPPLSLVDKDGATVSLQGLTAPFTLLIFYSPLCHHCMDVMPGIYATWQKYEPKGLKALAVSTDDQYAYWKNFIAQQKWNWIDVADPTKKNVFIEAFSAYNLPVIYLLDKNKKIMWKRVPIEQLESVLARVLVARG